MYEIIKTCPKCHGEGWINTTLEFYVNGKLEPRETRIPCPICGGSGNIVYSFEYKISPFDDHGDRVVANVVVQEKGKEPVEGKVIAEYKEPARDSRCAPSWVVKIDIPLIEPVIAEALKHKVFLAMENYIKKNKYHKAVVLEGGCQ